MTPKHSLNQNDIIRLLSKLKEETPEYPSSLLEARKASILKQAATLKIQGKGQGGGEGGSGGSGAALGGSAAQGILLQALVGFSLIAAMLMAAFANREKISEILNENIVVTGGEAIIETLTPPSISTVTADATATPVLSPSPQVSATGTPIGLDALDVEDFTILDDVPGGIRTNPGLHLGQTEEAPAAPGQGNPGNINQPDKSKPDKPDKPDRPDRPDRPQH